MDKIITVVGTRPELIRMSSIIKKLDEHFNQILVHTGQNSASNMKDVFFDDLELRSPDHAFDMASTNLGKALGELFSNVGRLIEEEQPKALVLLGDTNSGLCSVLARRMNILVYHLEAGNRSYDLNVPEEVNRKIIDHSSNFNLVYTEQARRNLLAEGVHPRHIFLIGSPLREVLLKNEKKISNNNALSKYGLTQNKFMLLSLHRQENTSSRDYLQKIISNIIESAGDFNLPILFSAHPRTLDRISQLGIDLNNNFITVPAMGFIDYIQIQRNAFIVLSDSGSISEEAAILNLPAITIRESMERPEALECGVISLSSMDSKELSNAIKMVKSGNTRSIPPEYLIEDTSHRVANIILSTIALKNDWFGLRL